MLKKICHLGYAVENLDIATRFYTEHFGAAPGEPEEVEEQGIVATMFEVVSVTGAVLNTVPFFAGEATAVGLLVARAGLSAGATGSLLAMDQLLDATCLPFQKAFPCHWKQNGMAIGPFFCFQSTHSI